jgi:hypothetical protein
LQSGERVEGKVKRTRQQRVDIARYDCKRG